MNDSNTSNTFSDLSSPKVETGVVVSTYHPLKHYIWGDKCDGWNLVDEPSLSVKQERMPAGSSEAKHYHQQSQQFFYILKGIATFEVNKAIVKVEAGEGFHIPPNTTHCIHNRSSEVLEFILCSQPSTSNDRINCE